MECDELIEQMLKESDAEEPMTDKSLDKHRERLAASILGKIIPSKKLIT